ncbi:MAG: phosphatase PAP2 family protein [Flavobacteriaceae bacterium]
MLDLIVEYDHKLFLWLNNLGNESFDWFWMLMTNKLFNFFVYSIALIYLLKKTDIKSLISMILFLSILILISDQTSNLFKNFFERLRPCHDEQISSYMRLVKDSCGGFYSFFSAHASNSFSLASFFFFVYYKIIQRKIILFFVLASLVSYSRVYIGVHYPLDIITGSIFGFVSGFILFKFWIFSLKRINTSNS